MTSLADLYNQIASADEEIEKIAAEEAVSELCEEADLSFDEDTEKVAAEYDAAGRLMARSFFSEMLKVAQEEEEKEEEEEEGKEEEEGSKKKKKGKKVPPQFKAMMEEKKAALKQQMLEDPEFAQAMFERYGQTE